MYIVIKVEHYDAINLISKHEKLEDALAEVMKAVANKFNAASASALPSDGSDISHHCNIDSVSVVPDSKNILLASANADCNGESTDWGIFSVDNATQFILLKNVEYGPMNILNSFKSFDRAYSAMKEDLAKEVNEAYYTDFTADDMEDNTISDDYNVFLCSDENSTNNGAPLAAANFCESTAAIDWCIFKL